MIEIVLRDSSSNMYDTCDDDDAVRPASIPLNSNFEESLHVDWNNVVHGPEPAISADEAFARTAERQIVAQRLGTVVLAGSG